MKERSFQDYFRILKRDITKYVELKLELYRLNFTEGFSKIITKLVTVGVALVFGLIFLTFLLFTLAYFLGDILGATYWGFLIVSGIFLLIAVVFILLRNKIITNPIINSLISVLFQNEIKKEKKLKNEKKQ